MTANSRGRGFTAFSALLILTGLAVTGMSVAQTEEASIERGHDLARLVCSKCHAIDATGTSPNPDAPPFRTLLEKLTLEGIEDELAEGIRLGHQPMPQWEFSSQQIYDLGSFIASLGE